jgi:hypothetical protein
LKLVGIAINILPVGETRTVAAFSYAKKDQGSPRRFGPHPELDGEMQKCELSQLVLSRISNVLISPRRCDRGG